MAEGTCWQNRRVYHQFGSPPILLLCQSAVQIAGASPLLCQSFVLQSWFPKGNKNPRPHSSKLLRRKSKTSKASSQTADCKNSRGLLMDDKMYLVPSKYTKTQSQKGRGQGNPISMMSMLCYSNWGSPKIRLAWSIRVKPEASPPSVKDSAEKTKTKKNARTSASNGTLLVGKVTFSTPANLTGTPQTSGWVQLVRGNSVQKGPRCNPSAKTRQIARAGFPCAARPSVCSWVVSEMSGCHMATTYRGEFAQ